MLNRNSGPTKIFGILIGLEIETGVCTPEKAAMKLGDALNFTEGVGSVTVDVLGEIDTVDETEGPNAN